MIFHLADTEAPPSRKTGLRLCLEGNQNWFLEKLRGSQNSSKIFSFSTQKFWEFWKEGGCLTRKEKDEFVGKISRRREFKKLRAYAFARVKKMEIVFLFFIRAHTKGTNTIAETRCNRAGTSYSIAFNSGRLRKESFTQFILTFAHELGHIEIGLNKRCPRRRDKNGCPLEETNATLIGIEILKKLGCWDEIKKSRKEVRIFLGESLVKPLICSEFEDCVMKIIASERKRKWLFALKKWQEKYEKKEGKN